MRFPRAAQESASSTVKTTWIDAELTSYLTQRCLWALVGSYGWLLENPKDELRANNCYYPELRGIVDCDHWKGQSSLPTKRTARALFFGSMFTTCFTRAFAANSSARFLSWIGSAEERKSFPSGPNIASKPGTSYSSAARIKAAAACSGV